MHFVVALAAFACIVAGHTVVGRAADAVAARTGPVDHHRIDLVLRRHHSRTSWTVAATYAVAVGTAAGVAADNLPARHHTSVDDPAAGPGSLAAP